MEVLNVFILQGQNRRVWQHCYTWADFQVSYLCGKSHFCAYEPIQIRFGKPCFFFNKIFTWFIFRWISFLILSFWSILDRGRIINTRRSCRVSHWQGALIWVWWCWYGWVYVEIWFLLIRYISSMMCIFVSFFWWQQFSWF